MKKTMRLKSVDIADSIETANPEIYVCDNMPHCIHRKTPAIITQGK